jgi:hypothetical protein
MSNIENFNPFELIYSDTEKMWLVLLADPVNPDNCVVVYRSSKVEDCNPVWDALNHLMQKQVNHLISD